MSKSGHFNIYGPQRPRSQLIKKWCFLKRFWIIYEYVIKTLDEKSLKPVWPSSKYTVSLETKRCAFFPCFSFFFHKKATATQEWNLALVCNGNGIIYKASSWKNITSWKFCHSATGAKWLCEKPVQYCTVEKPLRQFIFDKWLLIFTW